jgi:hypothetical protein
MLQTEAYHMIVIYDHKTFIVQGNSRNSLLYGFAKKLPTNIRLGMGIHLSGEQY